MQEVHFLWSIVQAPAHSFLASKDLCSKALRKIHYPSFEGSYQ